MHVHTFMALRIGFAVARGRKNGPKIGPRYGESQFGDKKCGPEAKVVKKF